MTAPPLSKAAKDFEQRFIKLSTAVDKGRTDTLKQAAMIAKTVHTAYIRRDAGSDMILSGVGRRKGKAGGRKVGVRYDIARKSGEYRAEIIPTGPLPLISHDTPGHVIRSAYLRGALRTSKGQSQAFGPAIGKVAGASRRTVINIPGVGWRPNARHPGTTGKRTWERGRTAAKPKIDRKVESEMFNIIKRGFG